MIRLSTWLLGFLDPAFMVTHKGLHNGMVCGIHVGVEWKGTLALTIVRCVSLWSDDPVLAGTGERNFRVVDLLCRQCAEGRSCGRKKQMKPGKKWTDFHWVLTYSRWVCAPEDKMWYRSGPYTDKYAETWLDKIQVAALEPDLCLCHGNRFLWENVSCIYL